VTHDVLHPPRAILDRRTRSRSFSYTRPTPGRRRARRTYLFDQVFWNRDHEPKCQRGILVGVSDTGLALVVEHRQASRPGMCLKPTTKKPNEHWCELAVVTRVDELSETLDLVTAAFPPTRCRNRRTEREHYGA
jgi:hypothetical protein